MSSREIVLWVDERWYDALTAHLNGETLEKHLEGVIDDMCAELPRSEFEGIAGAILEEQQQAHREMEANRKLSIFHTTEHGKEDWFISSTPMEMLTTARWMRNYLQIPREDQPKGGFAAWFRYSKPISPKEFNARAIERMENTGRIVGAYEINLDEGTFSTLNIMDGWQVFKASDVSAAAYHAFRKQQLSDDARWDILLEHLDGKAITASEPMILSGSRTLAENEISFSEDIVQQDNRLEFYMDVVFDPDAVFGTSVCSTENDNYLNVYAYYDMDNRHVCDELTVILCGAERDCECRYKHSDSEKKALLPKMDEHSRRIWSLSLDDCVREYWEDCCEGSPAAPTKQKSRGDAR